MESLLLAVLFDTIYLSKELFSFSISFNSRSLSWFFFRIWLMQYSDSCPTSVSRRSSSKMVLFSSMPSWSCLPPSWVRDLRLLSVEYYKQMECMDNFDFLKMRCVRENSHKVTVHSNIANSVICIRISNILIIIKISCYLTLYLWLFQSNYYVLKAKYMFGFWNGLVVVSFFKCRCIQ